MQQPKTVYPVNAAIWERQGQGIALDKAAFAGVSSGNQALGFDKAGIGRVYGKDI